MSGKFIRSLSRFPPARRIHVNQLCKQGKMSSFPVRSARERDNLGLAGRRFGLQSACRTYNIHIIEITNESNMNIVNLNK